MSKTVIKNASLNGSICNIECENGIITSINQEKGLAGYDADGRRVIPGLIEVHAHGCIGMDTLDGDFAPMCDFMAKKGTTSWLPTTMTVDIETLVEVTNKKTDFPGAHILGFHLEGPYISPKYKGAQNEAHIKAPNYEEFKRFQNVKMITIAPEQPGSLEFIKRVSAEGVVTSIGHSDANYAQSIDAIDAGVTCLTHTFNRMAPLHHRDPGPIAAGAEKGIWAQIITDGIHVHKSMILAALKMYGKDRLTLISDSIRPAGLPEGTVSESGGIAVVVRDGACYLDGTDTLAGSGATLWDCVKYCVSIGIPFEDAVIMATRTPARMLGVNKGEVREGFDADLLIVDDKMEIEDVFVSGERYER